MPRTQKTPHPTRRTGDRLYAAERTEANPTSVRTLVTSVTELARACGITTNGVYRWIKVNRIPGKYIIKVAALYDVEIPQLLPLTGSDKANVGKPLSKPKATLETLLQVYQGKLSIEAAADTLGTPIRSLKLVMFHWGDELPTLYTTLKQLEEKRISLDDACARLKVTKYTLHGIRKKYGYAPGKLKRTRPVSQIGQRRQDQRAVALDVIAGRRTAVQAAADMGVSYRSMFRFMERLTEDKLQGLSHWPMSFRAARVEEIDKKLPNYAEKWLNFAEKHRLVLGKRPKYPKIPNNWKELPLKRLLVGVLLDEASLEEIAASRGGDPVILKGLFTGDLKPLGVTFDKLRALPMAHQMAVAEVLLSIMDRKRRLPT